MCDDWIDGFWDCPDVDDWMIIGPLAEDLTEDQREQERLEKENNDEADKDYWDIINEP